MNFSKPIPILRMFDEQRTREFYVDFLGFKVDWEHRFAPDLPLYMQVSLGDCVLHLSGHHGDCCPGGAIRLPMMGIDGYLQSLAAKKYKHSRPGGAQSMPWGSRDCTIADPSGNKITFAEPTSPGS